MEAAARALAVVFERELRVLVQPCEDPLWAGATTGERGAGLTCRAEPGLGNVQLNRRLARRVELVGRRRLRRRSARGAGHGASKGVQSLIALQKFSRFSPSTLSYNETH